MNSENLPSSSDESDVDFLPEDEDCKSNSCSEVSDYENTEIEDKILNGHKRKKGNKGINKKAKLSKFIEEKEENANNEKEEKIDINALWADFKKDVGNLKSSYRKFKTEDEDKSNDACPSANEKKAKGGLSKVLTQIAKKDKMSTLQKSQLDWNNFKKSEGIEEEIKTFNKGKDGYLEKQDFLQRTDLRQFEIEKDLRSARRKF